MLIPAHAGVSWFVANLCKGDRRLRTAVFLCGVLPDLDGFGMFINADLYLKYHHVLTHGLVFSLISTLAATVICRGYRMKALLLTQGAFYLHYFGDYFFTRWRLYYFAPFSMASFGHPRAVWLYHPINTVFVVLAMLAVIAIGVVYKRTPLEILSPSLDARVVNLLFRARRHRCSICNWPGNEVCISCGALLCIRHSWLSRGLSIQCRECRKS